jgi:DNA-directed RNA polymerase beta subunit
MDSMTEAVRRDEEMVDDYVGAGAADDDYSAAAQTLSTGEQYALMESFACRYGVAAHQTESFNDFLLRSVPNILEDRPSVTVDSVRAARRYVLSVDARSVSIGPAGLRAGNCAGPLEAREVGGTLSVSVVANFTFETFALEGGAARLLTTEHLRETEVMRVPVMVGSAYCPTAPGEEGGYFIVNGSLKVVIGQVSQVTNQPFVTRTDRGYEADIRSLPTGAARSTSTLKVVYTRGRGAEHPPTVVVHLPFMGIAGGARDGARGAPRTTPMPLRVVLAALGCATVEDAVDLVLCHGAVAAPAVAASLREVLSEPLPFAVEVGAGALSHADQAVAWIARHGRRDEEADRRISTALYVLASEFLPHEESGDQRGASEVAVRALGIGRVVRALLDAALGGVACGGRDRQDNLRVASAGLLSKVLYRRWRGVMKDIAKRLQAHGDEGKPFSASKVHTYLAGLTTTLHHALSTGDWGSKRDALSMSGVSTNYTGSGVARLSQMRRLNHPSNRNSAAATVRQVDPSQVHYRCVVETPEGGACGLVGALAVGCRVRPGSSGRGARALLARIGIADPLSVPPALWRMADFHPVRVNGALVGLTDTPEGVAAALREARRRGGVLAREDSIVRSPEARTIDVFTDAGCMVAPYIALGRLADASRLIAAIGATPALFDALLSEGIVVFMDSRERCSADVFAAESLEDAAAAQASGCSPAYTHAPFHAAAMLGTCALPIVFANHNQATRNPYGAGMAKQAICAPSRAPPGDVGHTATEVLCMPQAALVSAHAADAMGLEDDPRGVNVVLAIMDWPGADEDGFGFKREAIDLGLFKDMTFSDYSESDRRTPDRLMFGIPPKEASGRHHADYGALLADGLPRVGATIRPGDAVIGMHLSTAAMGSDTRARTDVHDKSTFHDTRGDDVRVHTVAQREDAAGSKHVRVRVCRVRDPQRGDKFCSSHGQKGVISYIFNARDAPFDPQTGMTPDVIMGGHALQSRKAMGMLIEMFGSKFAALAGVAVDGTAFSDAAAMQARVRAALLAAGLSPTGKHRLYDGQTGEPLPSPVFMGPCFLMRLRWDSRGKIHARATGPLQPVKRAPVGGKKRNGGAKVGEMERDALIGHGCAAFLEDRFFDNADGHEVPICKRCGNLADPRPPLADARVANFREATTGRCRYCEAEGSPGDVRLTRMRYCFKTLVQELAGMNIGVRFELGP